MALVDTTALDAKVVELGSKVDKAISDSAAAQVQAGEAVTATAALATKVDSLPAGVKGDKGDPATVNIRAVQADGAVNCDSSEALVSVFCPSGGAADGAKCGTSPTIGLCMKQ